MQRSDLFLKTGIALTLVISLAACARPETEATSAPEPSMHGVNESASLINPVKPTSESLASGKKLYDRLCAECHGEKGDGISEIAAAMAGDEVRPPNLIDDTWQHGSTDGEIYASIRDGVGGPGAMKGLNGRPGIGPTEMWQMVNYVRSLKR
jgi:mono/diheme cytochrome c family protein